MKNRRSARSLLINCNGRTNLVSPSAQALKDPGSIIQIHGLTDDLILQRNQRVGRKHDSVGSGVRNRHTLSNGVPERELAQRKGRT